MSRKEIGYDLNGNNKIKMFKDIDLNFVELYADGFDSDGYYNALAENMTGNGTKDDSEALQTLLTTIDNNDATIYFPRGTYKLSTNITTPSNVNLKIENGAIFSIGSGIDLTINGGIEAGLWQIFSGDGSITGTPKVTAAYPEWFGAKNDDSTDCTDAFKNCVDLFKGMELQSDTYIHTGIVLTTERPFSINGKGMENTILKNVSLVNSSISILSPGGHVGYATGTKISNLRLDTNIISSGQYGIDMKLCTTIKLHSIRIKNHDRGINEYSCWNSDFYQVICIDNNIGWYVEDSSLNGTPNHRYICRANNNLTVGVYIENDLSLFKWIGGEIGGNGEKALILGNIGDNVINLEFDSVNFENNHGDTDIEVSYTGGGAPRNIAFKNCTFFRVADNFGTYCVRGFNSSRFTYINCNFRGFTYGIYDEGSSTAIFINCAFSDITTHIWMNGKTYEANAGLGVFSEKSGTYTGIGGTRLYPMAQSDASIESIFNNFDTLRYKNNAGDVLELLSGISGSKSFNPISLADGVSEPTTVTVTGAELGDFATASFSLDTQGVDILQPLVTAIDTVTVKFVNNTGGLVDLDSGTLRVKVIKA